eukprot:UN33324
MITITIKIATCQYSRIRAENSAKPNNNVNSDEVIHKNYHRSSVYSNNSVQHEINAVVVNGTVHGNVLL